jgi:hypothetical protein
LVTIVSIANASGAGSSELTTSRPEGNSRSGGRKRGLAITARSSLEVLNRHRGKGQQKMTVEHVHVHSGGQEVVGMVGTSGAGDHAKIEGQAHATQAQIGYARQPEMRCPQPQDRAAVPAAGDGKRPLSHAWRTIDGGAEG